MERRIGIVTGNGLNIRPEPSTDNPPVGRIRQGDEVGILEQAGDWYLIESEQGSGYVHGDYIELAEEGVGAAAAAASLRGFRGNVGWIHRWEGHAGKPYWPGGASGVTLDPGLDLGHAPRQLIAEAYQPRLSGEQYEAVQKVLGLRGQEAKAALDGDSPLDSIRVTRRTATEIFPLLAKPYWDKLRIRFPGLDGPDVPVEVHTAMLSIAYNRGAGNRALEILKQPVVDKDWMAVGNLIGAMQQDHSLEGIRKRRRSEGELIRSALA
ncbi:MAG: SH3 domain-containing protein [bacterium]|nr:SH3 domain-containing protein [bacterium]